MHSLKPTCLAMNSVGLRCGNDALPDSDLCQIHLQSSEEELYSGMLSASEFAENVLQSWEFRQYVSKGLQSGKIPAAIVLRLMDYAEGWGKPPERIEHMGDVPTITQVRRVVVFSGDEDSTPPKAPSRSEETVELQGEDLNIPLIPVPPRRMH